MKKYIVLFAFAFGILTSCNSTKNTVADPANALEGNWQLKYIAGSKVAFDKLYPHQKPNITFDLKESRIVGKNSCNTYSGNVKMEGNKIKLDDKKIISTKMFCEGEGENAYMNALRRVNGYSLSEDGKTLSLMNGNAEVMQFEKAFERVE